MKGQVIIGAVLVLLGCWHVNGQVFETHTFNNLNLAIPDGNASGRSDVRTVTSSIGTLASVRVRLNVAGNFNGDLYAYLRHVSGGTTNLCVLLNRVGRAAGASAGYADAGLDVTFDDGAANNIHTYRAVTTPPAGTPLTGTWSPDGRNADPATVLDTTPATTTLAGFDGMAGGGAWTLYLVDAESGGTNQLVSWELQLSGAVTPAIVWAPPADITYGTSLGAAQLNAACPGIPGTFAYSPGTGALLNAGNAQTLTAVFTPSDTATYNSVTSHVSVNVLRAASTGQLVASQNPALPGAPVTFTFTASLVPPGAVTPAGLVQFKVDGVNAGAPVALLMGAASFTSSTLPAGTHTVTAEYAGDSNVAGTAASLSAPLVINSPPVAGADTLQRAPTSGAKVTVQTLMSNDSDADGNPLTFVSFSAASAQGGTLTREGDWIFYTPLPGFTNQDSATYTISDSRGATAQGTITIQVVVDPAPSPNLQITDLGNGTYEIWFDGIPNRTYRVESTPSVGVPNWQAIGSATANALGTFRFTNTPPAGIQLFYRSVYP
jgi:subtilisin-like proprotein convertase family protein